MRRLLPPTLTVTLMPALNRAVSFAKSSDTRYARIVLPLVAWLVVGFVPLVSLDAVGGQTAVEIVRYVSFRGIDRDAWYAVAPVFCGRCCPLGIDTASGNGTRVRGSGVQGQGSHDMGGAASSSSVWS